MWPETRRPSGAPRGRGAVRPLAAVFGGTVVAALAFAAFVAAQSPPAPPVMGTSEDAQKVYNLLNAYEGDVRAVLHGGADADLALRHFDRSLVQWFDANFRLLAEFNTSVPNLPDDDATRRRVALDALCRYGPPMISYRIERLEFSGSNALMILTETVRGAALTYYLPLRRDPTNRWVFTTFFWSELLVWQPILILDKRIRDVPLTPEEEAFERTRQAARERFLDLCASVGVDPPMRF